MMTANPVPQYALRMAMSLAAMIPPVVLPLVRKSVLPPVVERNLYLQKRRALIILFLERKVVAVILKMISMSDLFWTTTLPR
jgi:hypothetical protein